MTKIIGRLVDIGIGKEAVRGGGVAPSFWVPKSNLTFEDKAAKARSVVNFGNIGGEGNQALVAMKHAEGVIDFDMMDQSFGLFLLSLLGGVSTGAQVDSAYIHTFTLQDTSNQHQSLAIAKNETNVGDLMFRLAMIETLTITIVPDDVVKVSATFMSRASAGSTQTASYTAENKFLGRHLTFKIAATTGDLAAAPNIPVRSLTLEFQKNLKLVHNTASVEPEDILNQAFRITGSVELDYEDRTYVNLMLDGNYRAVRIDLNNAQVLIGAATTPQFILDLSRVDFEAWEQTVPNDELVGQTFEFMALHDLTNGDIINSCTLRNAHDGSSY